MVIMYKFHNKNKKRVLNNEGVSEIIGTILLVTITVVIASILVVWVQSTPAPVSKRHVALASYIDLNATGGFVRIVHSGGETLEDGTTTIYVVINDTSNKLSIKDGLNGSLKWSIGQTWSYYNASITSNSSVVVSVIDMSTNEMLTSNTLQTSASTGGASVGRTLIAAAVHSDLTSIPADNTTQSRISTYLMYADGSVPTSANVTANLTAIGGNSTEPLSYNSSSGLYETTQLKIPEGVTPGTYVINITAIDAGNVVSGVATITVTAPPSIPEGTTQIVYTAVSENYAINGTMSGFSSAQSWTDGGAYATLSEKGIVNPPSSPEQTTLRPNAAGTYQDWTTFGTGSAHYDRTNDLSDTTGVQITGSTASKETEHLADPTFGDDATINSVTAYVKAKATAGEYIQVTYVSAGTGSGIAGDPTPAYPAGLETNDLILLQVTVRSTTATVTTPAGFAPLYGPDSSGTGRQWIYYKFATGTESGTITVDQSGATCAIGRMYAFRNVALSSFTEGGGFGTGAVATISAQAVTTTNVKRLAVSFVFVNDNNAVGSFTGETGGDWTEAVAQFTTTSGSDGCVQLQTATMASAGTITGGSYTMSAADPWGVRAFALIPIDPDENAVVLWRYGGADYEGTAITISRTAFTEYSASLGALTKSQITELEVGMRASTLGTTEIIQCSEIWVVVDYSPVVVTYVMEIQCNTTSIPSGKDAYYLQIYAKTDGEQFNISVYDGTNWNIKGSITSTLFTLFSYTLLPNEIINNVVYVKFMDTTNNTVQNNLYIDYMRVKSMLSG